MICLPCTRDEHEDCPERARQRAAAGEVTALGSQWCECQHQPRRLSAEELLRADAAAVADDDVDEACKSCGGPLPQSPEPWCQDPGVHGLVIA